jgi:hypothetical protein
MRVSTTSPAAWALEQGLTGWPRKLGWGGEGSRSRGRLCDAMAEREHDSTL